MTKKSSKNTFQFHWIFVKKGIPFVQFELFICHILHKYSQSLWFDVQDNSKCKEMRFFLFFVANGTPDLNPIVINDKPIDVASRAKVLGVNISIDLKRSHHIV